ncbi:hypothetical protein ACLOJK_038538 [Asimina triloba]
MARAGEEIRVVGIKEEESGGGKDSSISKDGVLDLVHGGIHACSASAHHQPLGSISGNWVVFIVFTPSLMFASLAKSVTLQDIISWWFMPVNIGLIFLFGGILGWIVVKLLKPARHLEGLVKYLLWFSAFSVPLCAFLSNLGNLLLIVVPAMCKEKGSPFGDLDICNVNALSYASFSMAACFIAPNISQRLVMYVCIGQLVLANFQLAMILVMQIGGFYIWTYTYHLIRSSSEAYDEMKSIEEAQMDPNKDLDANGETHLLLGEGEPNEQKPLFLSSMHSIDESTENQPVLQLSSSARLMSNKKVQFWGRVQVFLHQILEELLAPPTVAAVLGFIFGATPWLKSLIIGATAPLRVIQDSIKDGTIPCITLILGGNLTKGIRSAKLRPLIIICVIIVRYVILPIIGVGVVRAAGKMGFLSHDPLYQYVLLVQYTLPPAMNIGTMTQLFDVGQEECSVLYLWTYLVAALAVTAWSTFFLWILSGGA